jgi:hypothetical protein
MSIHAQRDPPGIAGLVLSGFGVTCRRRIAVQPTSARLSLILCSPGRWCCSCSGVIAQVRYQARDQIVAAVPWRGDEWVLDVPTGSGFMLLGCAQKLTTGKAIGVDLWLPGYGGGTADRFLNNIRAEGLSDRAECRTMDARQMTFEAGTFDVVISVGQLHGRNAAERAGDPYAAPVRDVALYDMAPGVNENLRTLRQLVTTPAVAVKLLIVKPAA